MALMFLFEIDKHAALQPLSFHSSYLLSIMLLKTEPCFVVETQVFFFRYLALQQEPTSPP